MVDREKVINALEYLISEDCTENQFDYVDEIETAIALLKEQEAVKIKVNKLTESGRCGRCPSCSNELNETDYPNYCGFCGQEMIWNE